MYGGASKAVVTTVEASAETAMDIQRLAVVVPEVTGVIFVQFTRPVVRTIMKSLWLRDQRVRLESCM